jgi:hypothetical protein
LFSALILAIKLLTNVVSAEISVLAETVADAVNVATVAGA